MSNIKTNLTLKKEELRSHSLLKVPESLGKMIEISIESTLDHTMQPNLFWEADTSDGPKPLIVGLHTWGATRFTNLDIYQPWAEKFGWHLLMPEYRGQNRPFNPEPMKACGSRYAKQDIIDAVNYVKENYKVDTDNIFIIGGSGGGHMALLMAGYTPELWRAVAAFCPITDLEANYIENRADPKRQSYANDIIACCGGEPGPYTADEYKYRSPLTYAAEISRSNTQIWSGLYDPAVKNHHGYDMFAAIFSKYPGSRVFFNMFDGGHDLLLDKAEEWFMSQLKKHNTEDTSSNKLTG